MTPSTQDKRLIYKSSYRGMKELDVIFRAFCPFIQALSLEEKRYLDHLLDQPEAILYQWFVRNETPDPAYQTLVDLIRIKTSL